MSGRVGYRFHPTDEELVNYFLKHKMDGYGCLVDDEIRPIDLLKYEPWELPGLAAEVSNDQVWYFFCKRELKYKNSSRTKFNRSTGTGHWKPTGIEHIVKAKGGNQKIGTKRTLVFYSRSSPKEIRTDWVIQEYQPTSVLPHQDDFVLCKLKDKSNNKADSSSSDQAESIHNKNTASDHHRLEIPTPRQVPPELPQQSLTDDNGINFDNGSATQQQILIEEDGISLDDPMFATSFDKPQKHPIRPIELVFQSLEVSLGASNSHSIQANPRECRQMPRVQTSTETLPPSTFNQSGMQKNHSHSNEILVIERTDSEEIDPIGETSKFATQLKAPMQPPKPGHLMAIGEAKPEQKAREATDTRTGTQKPISGQVMATAKHQGKMSIKHEHEARVARKNDAALDFNKENLSVKTEKDHKMVTAKTNMTCKCKTCSFIHQETSILSQESIIIGLILLVVVILFYFWINRPISCMGPNYGW